MGMYISRLSKSDVSKTWHEAHPIWLFVIQTLNNFSCYFSSSTWRGNHPVAAPRKFHNKDIYATMWRTICPISFRHCAFKIIVTLATISNSCMMKHAFDAWRWYKIINYRFSALEDVSVTCTDIVRYAANTFETKLLRKNFMPESIPLTWSLTVDASPGCQTSACVAHAITAGAFSSILARITVARSIFWWHHNCNTSHKRPVLHCRTKITVLFTNCPLQPKSSWRTVTVCNYDNKATHGTTLYRYLYR